MRRAFIAFLFFAALVLVWELAVRSGRWSAVLLPSPLSVGEYLWASMTDGSLVEAVWVTMKRLLLGYFIGDYFQVFARRGIAYVHYNANYRSVQLLGHGFPIPQQDNFLDRVTL